MSLRLTPEDMARLDTVTKLLQKASRVPLTKTTVTRLALLLGLEMAARNPDKVLKGHGEG